MDEQAYEELLERGRSINRLDGIDPRRTALLVIDLQNGFLLPSYAFGMPRALALVPMANRLARATRAAGGRVVWTRHTYAADGPQAVASWQLDSPVIAQLASTFIRGTEAHELHAHLEVVAGDLLVDKYRYSAFTWNSSELHGRLRAEGLDTLIVMGCAANCCCESTSRDAYQLGYRVVFVADGNAAPTEAEEAATRVNVASVCADVRPADEVVELLAGRAATVTGGTAGVTG
jgi:ureidoacrylate peracid hydrolase